MRGIMFGGRLKRQQSGFHSFPTLTSPPVTDKFKSDDDKGLEKGLVWNTDILDDIVEDHDNDQFEMDGFVSINEDQKENDTSMSDADVDAIDAILSDDDSKEKEPSFAVITEDIGNIFEYEKQLGSGRSCRVLKAKHIESGKIFALKEMSKSDPTNRDAFVKERNLLRKLHHPHIVDFGKSFVDRNCYYLTTAYCSGGTMLDKIARMKAFSEQKASEYLKTVIEAVHYMHTLGIVHRDLKANNIVFDRSGLKGVLKIIDFGDSLIVEDGKTYDSFVGTIHYVPPEITRKGRSASEMKAGDLWSVGVIAYILVCGEPPFVGNNPQEILKAIKAKNKVLRFAKYALTDAYKDFVNKLLCDDTAKRMTAEAALKHEWIAGDCASTKTLSPLYLDHIQKTRYTNKLQSILFNAILSELDRDEEQILNDGLIRLNRSKSVFNSSECLEYLMLHTPIAEMPHSPQHDATWQQSRVHDLELISQSSTEQLSLRRNSCSVPRGLPHAMSLSSASKALNQIRGDYDDQYDEDSDDSSGGGSVCLPKLTNDPSAVKSLASQKDIDSRQITVTRFRAILEQSGQKMDIDALVDKLQEKDDDGIPIIPLKHLMTRQLSTIFTMEPMDDINGNTRSSGQDGDKSLFDLIQMGMLLADEDIEQDTDEMHVIVSPLAMSPMNLNENIATRN